MTAGGDVTDHVTADVGESHTASDSGSESEPETMTSLTSGHVTTSNSVSRSPGKSPSSLVHHVSSAGQGGLRQTLSSSSASASLPVNARTPKNVDTALDVGAGRDGSSEQDLETMLSQVEASERQAWSWLEALNAENGERVGDLRHYITTMEQNKRQTSEAIAQLLQIECSLRQQLNRKRSAAAGLLSSDHDDALLDEVSRSLKNIVGRLQTQHGPSSSKDTDTEHSRRMMMSSTSRYQSTGSEAAVGDRLSHRNQNGGGVESDEGYDANSSSLKSDSMHGYGNSFHGYRDAEPTTTRIAVLESEVIRLTRLLDAYRKSHGENQSLENQASDGELGARPGYVDTSLQHAQSDVRRLQSRVNDVETEKLQLERNLHKATNKLRDDVEKLQSELQLQKNESSHTISELEVSAGGLRRTVKELREQLDVEKDKCQCLEKELLDIVEGREQLHQQLQESDRCLSSLRERMEMTEQSNNQLMAQVNFLTKTNESLMEDIDDNNEQMSEELASCRQGRTVAEARCSELEAQCQKLTETVGLLVEKSRALEKALEEAERNGVECERLRHEHNVLVASEEKLVDKINDKDDVARRLMDELSDCKRSLEEQSHKLQMANIALETCKDDESRRVRELEERRGRERELEESEKRLAGRVKELEMTEAVLTTKLSALETDKELLSSQETQLRCELDERRRTELELTEKAASLERREGLLMEKVERMESRATRLVDVLRNTQEMSLRHQVFDVSHVDDEVDDDDAGFHLLPDSGDRSGDQQASGYDLERMTRVDLLTKVYQLERKCLLQRNKIRDLSSELSTFRQTVAEASSRQMDTVLPVLMSTVENKV